MSDEEPDVVTPISQGGQGENDSAIGSQFSERDPLLSEANTAESEEEGEDLVEDLEKIAKDYKKLKDDHYEADGLDEDVDEGDYEQQIAARLAADAELDRRNRLEGDVTKARLTRLPAVLEEDLDEVDEERPRRRRRVARGDHDGISSEPFQLNRPPEDSNLRSWIATDRVNEEIRRNFKKFLETYRQEGSSHEVYREKIEHMVSHNSQSLEVSYIHLAQDAPILAVWVADAPSEMLEIFNEEASDVVHQVAPHYNAIHSEIYVRITELPVVDSIRDIRQIHLNALIRVAGVVTRRTNVFPQLQMVMFDCTKCGSSLGPFVQNGSSEVKPIACPDCQSRGPFVINVERTVYRNFQRITLQEKPGDVPAGRLPRTMEVILLHDLIDQARPGDEIEVTGIYTNNFDAVLNMKNGFPVFSTSLEANSINKRDDKFTASKLTDEDREEILRLARDENIGRRVIKSIAPSIFGHKNVKTALALSMFSGVEKTVAGKHRVRGDINVLLLGDPGLAKSQFLKYIENTAQRAVYTTGKGASAVGLTAAVHRDPVTKEWTLEGGALVLADKGICLIDEFDKMSDQDRVSIHEAMEQQSISISKAGIVTSLQARCAVIAAANPIGGRYDPSKSFSQNVDLTDPILTRFDLLLVLRDVVDPLNDERLAQFVTNSHAASHPDQPEDFQEEELDNDILTQETLRKYVAYAKAYVRPKLEYTDTEKIQKVYAELRRESMGGNSIPIAVRHLESLIRMSEAHARMHLREFVREEDVNVAIKVLLESFISTQKHAAQKALEKAFRRFIVMDKDYNELVIFLLDQLWRETYRLECAKRRVSPKEVAVSMKELENRARQYDVPSLAEFYVSNLLEKRGYRIDAQKRELIKAVAG